MASAAAKPQSRSRTGAKGQETAARVRKAALKRFAVNGYAAVSMREIAADVGVQPGALYNHFPTKQDILKDLLLAHMSELLAAWDAAAFPVDMDPLERFVRFHIRYHLERADEVFISYMELRNLEPDNFETVETERRRYEGILTEILEKGSQQDRYSLREPRVTTRAIIAMLTAIPSWYREGGRLSRQDIEEIYLDLARKAVAPEK
ncbi:transcriptional regulator, TetR family protein [Roseibium aggregatum IAM 12614]|uniref:Transcriptional regulator, TetR family protein n=1 Tax=Roseibium aggregatum (strain ATCC 25650 / DSM 13394 / JCM 20685 / NBRC 16684 / NCIMB 2208 / IAM 12614 / B1) TaxID=384765 RepID=A0NYS9_ROSAI|nr:TetR/AcrR family transcriptional regulator [Roseibium aggregatum]EAV41930.1 transcriptional regulator, TetR family protein [Roseibium aggregatum IAM 12614]